MGIPEFLSETRTAEQEEHWEAALGETVGGVPIREGAAGETQLGENRWKRQSRGEKCGWGGGRGRDG